jgi:hypothetical protein
MTIIKFPWARWVGKENFEENNGPVMGNKSAVKVLV